MSEIRPVQNDDGTWDVVVDRWRWHHVGRDTPEEAVAWAQGYEQGAEDNY